MKKTTKGAVAAAASAALLLGGAGSLAYWNADGSIAGGSVSSGELKLVSKDTGSWYLNNSTTALTPAQKTALKLVPGDELVYKGAYTVKASGDNIKGNLTVTGGTNTAWAAATITPTYKLDGTAFTGVKAITAADNNKDVAAEIRIDFPFGTAVDNTSQLQTINLAAVAVNLVQVDATPAP